MNPFIAAFVWPFNATYLYYLNSWYVTVCVQDAVRLSLLYCLHAYRGDENIKTFIWDLITPGGGNTVGRNHSGLSAPVPRGRKGKKARKEFIPEGLDWLNDEKFDAEAFLDKNYR